MHIPAPYRSADLEDFELPLPAAVERFLAAAEGARIETRDTSPARPEQRVAGRDYNERILQLSPDVAGLLLAGSVGVGKTHLAVALLSALQRQAREVDAQIDAAFIDVPEMIQGAKEAIGFGEHRPKLLEKAQSCDLVVLDDVAGFRPTEFATDTVVGIIRRRYNRMLTTIFTANAEPAELTAVLGEQIVSRMREMAYLVELAGADRRAERRKELEVVS